MVLSSIYFSGSSYLSDIMMLPIAIGAVCIFASIVGTYFVKLAKAPGTSCCALQRSCSDGILSIAGLAIAISQVLPNGFGVLEGAATRLSITGEITGQDLFWCGVTGLVITGLIVWITEYYTSTEYRPVRSIAKASESGHGTNVIQGLAVSLESTALPALTIMAGIILTFNLAGLFGIAIATTTMLALAGIIVALDAFGPVTDNAGGIAEMAELPSEVRDTTDLLDAVGKHNQGRHQGLCHWFGWIGCTRVVCSLYGRPEAFRRPCCRG